MDNNDGLTGEQTEKILQFQDLIGIEDITICRDVLMRHQWDLEVAIQEQLNIREGRPSMYATASDNNRPPQVVNDRYLQRVFSSSREPIPPTGFTGILGFIFNYVFSFCYNTISSIIATLLGIVRSNDRIVTDPLGDVLNYIQAHNEKFPKHPVFYQGTYAQALNDAKRELRFLGVYLHSQNSAEAISFCRNALSDDLVIEYINRSMLFWACDIASPEGYRVSHSIGARSYPTMVIVALRANKMIIMGRLEGDCTPTELLRRLQTVITDNDVWLSQARADRLERSLTQTLRQQQDEAYEQSLRADQEKERLKQLEKEKLIQKQLDEEAELFAEQQRKEEIARQKIEIAAQIPPEPAENQPNTIRLLFKLPNGSRLERRFDESDQLINVYNFVFSQTGSPDSFEITRNFPKRVLDTKDTMAHLTLTDVGLQNREVLFVNDLDA